MAIRSTALNNHKARRLCGQNFWVVAGRRQRQDWVEGSRGRSGGGEGEEDGEIGDLLLLQCSAAAPAGKDCCRSGRYIFLRKCCLLDWGGKLREKGFFWPS